MRHEPIETADSPQANAERAKRRGCHAQRQSRVINSAILAAGAEFEFTHDDDGEHGTRTA